ncbi:ubiquinol-cytochrome c reductase complex assembly factor 2-like [Ptiloglossa arizonensis]|uniref:ubiquinol-cytochrome c reductase complex assembly factor 2-like n=1 Tax=Ptiloglossa arizonensis TaxID=3350558 RepID=UPI003F9ECD33
MAFGSYKNYLQLLKCWPLDKSKVGRDLGEHIRDRVKLAFIKCEVYSQVDQEQCDRYYLSLKRIVSNQYGQTYAHSRNSSATGLNREQCNLLLTPDMLEHFELINKGIFSRTYAKLKNHYNAAISKI